MSGDAAPGCKSRDGTDGFDELPDHLVIHILNLVGDARSLARCRPVCRRLNHLVPQADCLLIRVDAVVSIPSGGRCFLLPLLGHLLRSAIHSVSGLLISSKTTPSAPKRRSPADLIREFDRIRLLEIELPGGDLHLEKGAVVRWRADFGGSLRRCAILAARRIVTPDDGGGGDGGEEDAASDLGGGIKERVIWTIGVLVSASARHYMAREVVRARRRDPAGKEVDEMERLVVKDRDGEGVLLMDREGVSECVGVCGGGGGAAETEAEGRELRRRTTVPAVRMRMRYVRALEVGGGVRMEGATLVVVRAAERGGETEDDGGGAEADGWARGAFEGPFRCAAAELLKRPSYLLEMNSF